MRLFCLQLNFKRDFLSALKNKQLLLIMFSLVQDDGDLTYAYAQAVAVVKRLQSLH